MSRKGWLSCFWQKVKQGELICPCMLYAGGRLKSEVQALSVDVKNRTQPSIKGLYIANSTFQVDVSYITNLPHEFCLCMCMVIVIS